MNTNYQVGSKVKICLTSGRVLDGEIVSINKFANFPIKVFFQKMNQVKYFNLNGENQFESKSCLEVVGHINEKLCLDFANYCLTEGYSTNATPDNFKKFLETYKPSK